jgi:ribonucleoside-diphosphate reductase alpha chain
LQSQIKSLASGDPHGGALGEIERLRACPRCGSQSLRRQEGCLVCSNCGYSKCN